VAISLRGRVIVVTGSTRGLGLALARAAAERGASVLVNGRSAEAVAASGLRGVVADVATPSGARALVDAALEAYGRIDALVCNAARSGARQTLAATAPDEVLALLADNLASALLPARELCARAPTASRVIVVSSEMVGDEIAGATPYAVAKAGLEGLVRALACEVEPEQVAVCALRLGPMQTEMTRALHDAETFAALPSVDGAVREILGAVVAPARRIHGRVLTREESGAAPRVKRALARAAEGARLYAYPQRELAALVAAIAAEHDVAPASVRVGAGSAALLGEALSASRCERVVASAPCWPGLAEACRARGLTLARVPLRFSGAAAAHDLAALVEAARDAQVLYLDTPNNPSGCALVEGDLARLDRALPPEVLLVLDEAYIDFAERPETLRAAHPIARLDRPAVVLRSLSKAHGLAGLRVGYALASPSFASALGALERPHAVSMPALVAARVALQERAHLARVVEDNRVERAAMLRFCDERGLLALRSEASFLLVRATWPADVERDAFAAEGLPPPERFGDHLQLPIESPEHNERVRDALRALHG
jgi:histidinol-phosphate aminotransferase